MRQLVFVEPGKPGRIDLMAVPTTVVEWAEAGDRWLDAAIKLVVTRPD